MQIFHFFIASRPSSGEEYEHAWLVVFGIVVFIALLFALLIWLFINYAKKIAKAQQIRAAEPICVWSFSPEDWLEYAAAATFVKDPKGAGELKITIYDIWITDENGTRSQSLNAKKLVTDCRVETKGIKVRRRWVTESQKSAPHYYVTDLYIPVPAGKDDDAAKVVDKLKAFMADHSEIVAQVMPPDMMTGLMGEVDF